jgi:hypothetical protein
MSRSGYSDDCDNVQLWQLWRGAVDRALHGARGQHFLRKLRDALDALPEKRLIADAIANEAGEVCALGAVDPQAKVDPYDRDAVARHFGIAPAMAAEIAYENDEYPCRGETPEQRWTRMRAWVEGQIMPDEAGA